MKIAGIEYERITTGEYLVWLEGICLGRVIKSLNGWWMMRNPDIPPGFEGRHFPESYGFANWKASRASAVMYAVGDYLKERGVIA